MGFHVGQAAHPDLHYSTYYNCNTGVTPWPVRSGLHASTARRKSGNVKMWKNCEKTTTAGRRNLPARLIPLSSENEFTGAQNQSGL